MTIPLRAKSEPAFLPPVRIRERQNKKSNPLVFVQREETPERNSPKNRAGIFSKTAAFLLVGLFLGNPVYNVYADELPGIISGEGGAVVSEETKEPKETDLSLISTSPTTLEEITVPETLTPTEETATTTDSVPLPSEEQQGAQETLPPSISETAEGVQEGTGIEELENSTTSSTEVIPEPVSLAATTTDEIIADDTEVATSTEENKEPVETKSEVIAPVASSTPESAEDAGEPDPTSLSESEAVEEDSPSTEQEHQEHTVSAPPVQVTNIIEHKYLFREHECTRLGDGGFYCAPPETAGTRTASSTVLPRVYVKSDASGGSKEIFFEDANGKVQITTNDTDDDAPSYDNQSGLIVWHSLVKGRYQIMLFDKNATTTDNPMKQLTSTEHSNTDPKVRGKSIVWQGWVNNNWEIFYIKDVTLEPFKIEQITTNEHPDMFPQLSDGFITWQSFFDSSWHVFVYTIESGEISQINQPEAGKYENPRFALLFENRKENGEVETVGYDVASGKEIPINAPHTQVPAPLPQEEKDQAVPVPSGQTGTSTSPLKNPGKDDEGHEL